MTSEVQPCGGYGQWWSFLHPMAFFAQVLNTCLHLLLKGLWRNGSASDSRSEGWEFESLWPHLFPLCSLYAHIYTLSYSGLKAPPAYALVCVLETGIPVFFATEETS